MNDSGQLKGFSPLLSGMFYNGLTSRWSDSSMAPTKIKWWSSEYKKVSSISPTTKCLSGHCTFPNSTKDWDVRHGLDRWWTDIHTHSQPVRQTVRHTGRQTIRQTDRKLLTWWQLHWIANALLQADALVLHISFNEFQGAWSCSFSEGPRSIGHAKELLLPFSRTESVHRREFLIC